MVGPYLSAMYFWSGKSHHRDSIFGSVVFVQPYRKLDFSSSAAF